ncbi:MAG: hypothetical protein LBT09_11305 [Planctomycetaceae bacterium]|nr:hypothetical protein [Planctomycetaceae bacterium]
MIKRRDRSIVAWASRQYIEWRATVYFLFYNRGRRGRRERRDLFRIVFLSAKNHELSLIFFVIIREFSWLEENLFDLPIMKVAPVDVCSNGKDYQQVNDFREFLKT